MAFEKTREFLALEAVVVRAWAAQRPDSDFRRRIVEDADAAVLFHDEEAAPAQQVMKERG